MYKQIIVHSLNHFVSSRGLIIYGWCLMSNKLYLIAQSLENASLENLKNELLVFTCEKIIDAMKSEPNKRNTWLQSHFQKHPVINSRGFTQSCWGNIETTALIDMRTPQSLAEQLEFIHSLPVKERVVLYGSDYIYSSSRDYEGMPGLVKITKPAAVENELYEIESRKKGFRASYHH